MRPIRALALAIAGGIGGLAAAAVFVKRAVPTRGDEESDEVALVAVFDGLELRSRARAFSGGSVLAWFGGVEIDLRDATLAEGARLRVHTLFGGVAIRTPAGWRVESGVHALAGGVDVSRSDAGPDAPTLTLDGVALFGGIAVGAERTAEVSTVSA